MSDDSVSAPAPASLEARLGRLEAELDAAHASIDALCEHNALLELRVESLDALNVVCTERSNRYRRREMDIHCAGFGDDEKLKRLRAESASLLKTRKRERKEYQVYMTKLACRTRDSRTRVGPGPAPASSMWDL